MLCQSFQKHSALWRKIHLSGYYKMKLNLWWQAWQQIVVFLTVAKVSLVFLLQRFFYTPATQCASDRVTELYSRTNEICQQIFQYLQEIASYMHNSLQVIIKMSVSERVLYNFVSYLMFLIEYAFTTYGNSQTYVIRS